jgi:uncharacterized phage protein gp47/JayE
MTIQPQSADPDSSGSIFDQIASFIAANSPITNFSVNSPEQAIVGAVADEFRERQHELLSVQLSARVRTSGKQLTAADLAELNVDPARVNLELLNSFQQRSDLDRLALRNGITRDPGSVAQGAVTFSITSDTAVIPAGTVITTPTDGTGENIEFITTEEAVASPGDSQVSVGVEAVERGGQGNIAAGRLTELPSPPPLVSAVTNTAATTGGEDEESNPELRERVRTALVGTAEGGTAEGVQSGLIETFAGLDENDVVIDESASVQPGFEVIARGGPTDTALQDEIDKLQPVAVEGQLVRPTTVTINVSADVSSDGGTVDTASVEDSIRIFIETLGLGSNFIRDQLIATIINNGDSIRGIDSLTTTANGSGFSNDLTVGPRESPAAGTISVSVV